MLLHSPLGLGHPYRSEPDQRIPIYPISGEPWRVRARTDEQVTSVSLYLHRNFQIEVYPLLLLGSARSDDQGPYGKTAKYTEGNTHLTDAAARSGEYPGELEWERHDRAMTEGIPLPIDVVESLKIAAELTGLDPAALTD